MNRQNLSKALAIIAVVGLCGELIYGSFKLASVERQLSVAEQSLKTIRDAAPDLVKTAGRIGFIGGCMQEFVELSHKDASDPLFPIFQEACVAGSKEFVKGLELKLEN